MSSTRKSSNSTTIKSLRVRKLSRSGIPFELDHTPYRYPEDVHVIIEQLEHAPKTYYKQDKDIGSIYYYNIPSSFDIETSSFYDDYGEKVGLMYIWMYSINGRVIYGRTWDQFTELIALLHQYTSQACKLLTYVHNMGFDFAFFASRLEWSKTFCSSVREPIYAITDGGIEFRDSYILTGKKLEDAAKDLTKYKIEKQTGDLDYRKLRGPKTPLTLTELNYCIYDCLVVDAIIQERIEQEGGSIASIPLTNTGYVRRFLRKKCFPTFNKKDPRCKDAYRYKALMQRLIINPDHYPMLQRAFQGGFTHANPLYVGQTIRQRVDSIDFTSSYPAVMCSEYFPMSRPKEYKNVSRETFLKLLKTKLLIFDVVFKDIRQKEYVFECPISKSKCKGVGIQENNGRIVKADTLATTITCQDFYIIKNFYDFKGMQIPFLLAYDKDYLPKPIIEGILELYKAKTELKGVDEELVNYLLKKGMLNACYGCSVQSPIKDLVTYTSAHEWDTDVPDTAEAIANYNGKRNRFLYYPWGIFVTAYARKNLFMGIKEFGADYIYSDTDSIKCINYDNHVEFIQKYNDLITRKIDACLTHYGIDPEESRPKTIKGETKQLGTWDWETKKHEYTAFKTLGAKRYMHTQFDDEEQRDMIHITVAGLGKKIGAEHISSKADPYEFFNDTMEIPEDATGKLTHTYIDEVRRGVMIDYRGEAQEYEELTGIHLEPAPYTLKLSKKFKAYLKVKGVKVNVSIDEEKEQKTA